jgi:hypothetical protein
MFQDFEMAMNTFSTFRAFRKEIGRNHVSDILKTLMALKTRNMPSGRLKKRI